MKMILSTKNSLSDRFHRKKDIPISKEKSLKKTKTSKPYKFPPTKYEVLGLYTYRTKDGLHYYQFQYVRVNNHRYAADIISRPSYENRNKSFTVTHLCHSPRANAQVQIDILNCDSFEKVKTISMEWAEMNSKYIHTGITIDKQIEAYSN